MSLSHSPKIATNGLVFAYDMGNYNKSWKGAPTTNLAGSNFFGGNGNFTINRTISDKMPDNTIGNVRELNAQIVTDGNRTVSIGSYSMTAGSTYTLSFYVKNVSCTGFGGNLYSPTLGRVIGSIVYPPTNSKTWTRVVTTFTVPNEGPNPVTMSPQVFRDGGIGIFKLCWLMVEQSNIVAAYTPTSRSNTEAIVDWTDKNTITANSLTYNSDGSFSFNGTSDFISSSFATTSGQALTVQGWVYSTETTANYKNFFDSVTQRPMIWWNTSGQIEFDASYYTTTSVYRNQWVQVALSKPAGLSAASYYVNGSLVGTGTAYSTPAVTPTWFNRSSAQTWKGNCSNIQVYNRTLSAAEVAQNFNALRGRYGI